MDTNKVHITFWTYPRLHGVVYFETSDHRTGSNPIPKGKTKDYVIKGIITSLGIDANNTLEII